MIIVSSDRLPERAKQVLKGYEIVEETASQKELEEAVALLTWPSKASKYLPYMKNLKVVQTFSAGVDDFPFQLLPKGVKLFSNAGAYSTSVAEHAFALILHLAKAVNVRERVEPIYLKGKTILILGGGGIGSEVARIAKYGFGMKVIGVSRSFKCPELFDERYGIEALDELLPKADVIVDALPLNKETKGILNYERFMRLKRGAIVVNVGRGETVDEEGVKRALKERRDIKFGTDVFWRRNGKEDFNSELWDYPNFAGTLHIAGGYGSREVLEEAMIRACENLVSYLKRGKAENEVRIEDYV